MSVDENNPFHGILTLSNQNKTKESTNSSTTAATTSSRVRPGRPPTDSDDSRETTDPVSITMHSYQAKILTG